MDGGFLMQEERGETIGTSRGALFRSKKFRAL
jgi:hypothetical protein